MHFDDFWHFANSERSKEIGEKCVWGLNDAMEQSSNG